MTRRKVARRKKQMAKKAKNRQQQKRQPQERKDTQLRWNIIGLILTVITGFLIPFYFQYEGDASLSHVASQLATIEAQQSSLLTPVAHKVFTEVGGLNLAAYCHFLGDSTSINDKATPYDWSCVNQEGVHQAILMSEVCQWQYNIRSIIAVITDSHDPFSVRCVLANAALSPQSG